MALPFNLESLNGMLPIVRAIILPFIAFILFNILLNLAEKALLMRAKTKKQITNIEIFHKLGKYLSIIVIIWVATLSYTGSFTGLGLSIGLFAVIIAWTFMRPLLGVVAWLTILVKRPFVIGDRIKIGEAKGDVVDLSLTHISIKEAGGLIDSEDTSGSIILVPNAFLFEHPVTNYTDKDAYVLQEVKFTITNKSDVDTAIKIALAAAKKVLSNMEPQDSREPYARTFFTDKGIAIHVRFFAYAKDISKHTSDVTYEIHKTALKTKKVTLAF